MHWMDVRGEKRGFKNDTHIFGLSNQGFSVTTRKIGKIWKRTSLDGTLRS